MTAGGAQVLLKSSSLAAPRAVFAGTGPLLYLVAYQYLKAGVEIRAILDTTPPANLRGALPLLPAALLDAGSLVKGRRWIETLRRAGILIVDGVEDLKLAGSGALESVEYRRRGRWQRIESSRVFLHQGVVPNVNLAMATGCAHRWSDAQLCWQAVIDDWAQSNMPGIAIAGDGAAIGGARAAESLGRIAAYGALHRCARLDARERDRLARPHRRALVRERRARPFLDRLFRPAPQFRVPVDDETIVCRCEEVTAGRVRASVALGCVGPNQLKGFSRCGMGPCQGRMCGLTVSEIIAAYRDVPVSEVGALRQRPPVKPLLLGELAALATPPDTGPGSG
jgi:NADPH-dependent 2,4-dienoyl-CoA reductase/sulfur reductase-like enzyme